MVVGLMIMTGWWRQKLKINFQSCHRAPAREVWEKSWLRWETVRGNIALSDFFLFGGFFCLGGILKVHLAPSTMHNTKPGGSKFHFYDLIPYMTMTLICQSATLGLYFKSIWNRRRKWSNQGDWKSRTTQFKCRCNCLILFLHLNRFFVVLYHIPLAE